ncbi:MAG: DUF445 family protein [Firmicutes bacterium]|nr:DUF445 family protein [Bacillota bacterium]
MMLTLWLMPVVGAAIGWLTNSVAVRMLFRPKQPIRVPVLNLTFQGVLPGRRADLAASVGRTVAEDLLPVDELLSRIDPAGLKGEVVDAVLAHVAHRFEGGLSRLLPGQVRVMINGYVREIVVRETEVLFDSLIERLRERVGDRIDVEALVTEKMLELDLDGLERLAYRIAGRELKSIVVLGAVLGFLIGLGQMGFALWLVPRGAAG